MKKTVLVYGLIGGTLMSVLMVIVCLFADKIGFGKSMIIGYATMLLGFTFVFVGIKSYRDTIGNGTISFGRAMGVGSLIALVASLIYPIGWMFVHHAMMPDFYQKYANYQMETMKAAHATAQEMTAAQLEMNNMVKMVANPVVEFFITLTEPLPVALLVTLISALILKRKPTLANS